nr:retrovirus-related Pol polyprotein from transposon TNT 1-94 [Tanacetum cinerariifolium]
MKIEESLNVTFDETPPPSKTSPLVIDDLDEEKAIKVIEKKNLENDIKDETLEIADVVNIKESRNHPLENVIRNLNQRTLRRNKSFVANDVWELVPQPKNMTIIGTKWVYRNKLDENGVISQNKARLVVQGYNQQEGIYYDETYAPVARLESIRILLAYACAVDFKLYQMDVKIAFLNGFINEEVYVAQPLGFINFKKSDHVYKLKKGLYGFKQAPKAWSERYNLAYFIAKRMEFVTKKARLILPYSMLLTRLFKYVMFESPELSNDHYVLHGRAMYPLTGQQKRKTRKDYGTRRGRPSVSASSSFAFGQPSSSHPNDDDNDGNDEGTSRATSPSNSSKKIKLTIIPPRQLFVDLTSKEYGTITPSPITKSSSPSPPNAPSKTPSTKDISSTFGITSSSFESKPQSLPFSSNDIPSP